MKLIHLDSASTDKLTDDLSESYGMPVDHQRALSSLADKKKLIIGFRPVSTVAKHYLELGHPGKPFGIDLKSSHFGPSVGLLCTDIRFSGRYDSSNKEDVLRHQRHLAKSERYMKKYGFQKVPLKLSPTRVKDLVKQSILLPIYARPECGIIYFESTNQFGKTLTFKAELTSEGDYHFTYINDKGENEVIKVLADKEGKEITCDYDLLVACPELADFSPSDKDKSPMRTQGDVLASHDSDEDELKGNISPRLDEFLDDAESELGSKLVCHNAEFYNPFAGKMSDNLPALFFLPEDAVAKIGLTAKVILVETATELLSLRDKVLEAGFYWPAHRAHKEYKPLGSERHHAATEAMERALLMKKNCVCPTKLAAWKNKIRELKTEKLKIEDTDTQVPIKPT